MSSGSTATKTRTEGGSVSTREAPGRGERGTPRGSCRRVRRPPPRCGERSETGDERAVSGPTRPGEVRRTAGRNRARRGEPGGYATCGESERRGRVVWPSREE